MSTNGHGNGKSRQEDTRIPFPCHFMIKVMGKAEGHFEKIALAIIQQHFPHFEDVEIEKRYSKDNRYLSLSVTVYAENQAQLDALYQELSSCKEILMVL